MAGVFIIDDICSVLLIVSVKNIYGVIKKYFAHKKASFFKIGLHLFAFLIPNMVQCVVIVIQIIEISRIKNKLSLKKLQEEYLPFYFLMLQVSFAIKQIIMLFIVARYCVKKKRD